MGKTSKEILNYRHECVDIYKMSKGCEECGYNTHPYNLCFDHLPGEEKSEHVKNGYSKRSSAGGMYRLYAKSHSIEDLVGEMKKCRVLCNHCHMKHTHGINNKRCINNISKKISSIEDLEKILREYEN
jgi:hypothetical protein